MLKVGGSANIVEMYQWSSLRHCGVSLELLSVLGARKAVSKEVRLFRKEVDSD